MGVEYSLNGKEFRHYGVYISGGFHTLVSGLKLQEQKGYVWPEYPGVQMDKQKKPMPLPREITLVGFVKGGSWDEMVSNFNSLFIDLKNRNTQRLLCEAYGAPALAFDVIARDEFPQLVFGVKAGHNVGVFELKLWEINPTKKLLYTDGNSLQLSFNTDKWIDLNIDGINESVRGVVNKTLSLAPRTIISSRVRRNLFRNSKAPNMPFKNGATGDNYISDNQQYGTVRYIKSSAGTNVIKAAAAIEVIPAGEYRSVSFKVRVFGSKAVTFHSNQGGRSFTVSPTGNAEQLAFNNVIGDGVGELQVQARSQNVADAVEFYIWDVMVTKTKAAEAEWSAALEDQHFIVLAGDIAGISNLQTNAQVLWEEY